MSGSGDVVGIQASQGQSGNTAVADQPAPGAAAPASAADSGASGKNEDIVLQGLLERIRSLTPGGDSMKSAPAAEPVAAPSPPPAPTMRADDGSFFPDEPKTLRAAQLSFAEAEALVLKLLLARGDMAGREIAGHVRLGFAIIEDLLRQSKTEQLVVHKGSASMNDFVYQLTDLGRERARRLSESCTYFGSAPVSLGDYSESVKAQSLTTQHPTVEQLSQAFSDLLVSPRMLERLGPAINSGRGMFLYGAAGNGKTSIAERITKAFGDYVWVPRAINVEGEVIRLFDPTIHEEAPPHADSGLYEERHVDGRWIRIRRPTIIVGGELTMENLEVTINKATGINEAPVQLKSNCGTLVIDDFGRQKMSVTQLLNRWIVPLEKRYDFLNLASGKKIQTPFDQLIIFSTNLQPKDLCDDAFLRRIPYKIEVLDPSESEFRGLFELVAPKMGFEFRQEVFEYLLDKHYRAINRPLRCCQPRDLLLQVVNYCHYHNQPLELTTERIDYAVENYFAVM